MPTNGPTRLRLRPEPVSLFEIFGGGGGDGGGEFIEFSHPEQHLGSRLRKAVEAQFGLLGLLPDAPRAGIESFLDQIEHLSDSRIWLVAPDLRPSLK